MLEIVVLLMLLMPIVGLNAFMLLVGYYMAHRHDSDI